MKQSKEQISYRKDFSELFAGVSGNFIFDGDKTISKREVVEKALLLARKFKKDTYISNRLKNCPEWWIVTLAGIFAGVNVLVHPHEKSVNECIELNKKYDAKVAFFKEGDLADALDMTDVNITDDLLFNGKVIIFTSGTTKIPKGVVIEMKNYVPNLLATQGRFHMEYTYSDVSMSPYSHVMGFMYGSCSLFFGGDVFICRNELEFVNIIVSKKANIACMQPLFLEAMKSHRKFADGILSLDYCVVAGAPMSRETYDLYCNLGAHIINGYGMSECVAAIAITDSRTNHLNDLSLDILDSSILSISSEGEILVSGSTVCERYLDGTSIKQEDGWFHTHDAGYIRNGKLYVTGRIDNVIVCQNGYKISIESIEGRLTSIDGIDMCVVEHIDNHLEIRVVSSLSIDTIETLVDSKLEYYERPFVIKKVDRIEVNYNGKKIRKH